ncbi:hypothetical protein ACFX2I_021300 [Malus domestica]
MPLPPEELRCPISLQLMYDPVIIASGKTYERICIEKWFGDGHNTCPKTQQKICPQSFWTSTIGGLHFESESTNSKYMGSIGSCKLKGVKVVPLEESRTIKEDGGNETEDVSPLLEEESDMFSKVYQNLLTVLNKQKLTRICKS